MKKELHPKDYRFVVFKDVSCDFSFLTRSTIETKEIIYLFTENIGENKHKHENKSNR